MINPLRDYADVEDIITRNWPTREAMIKADGADPARFKRLLGLIVSCQSLKVGKEKLMSSGHTRSPEGRSGPLTWRKRSTSGQRTMMKRT